MAKYKLLDFHICQTQLRFLSNSQPELKPLKSIKPKKILTLKAETTKFWSPNAQSIQTSILPEGMGQVGNKNCCYSPRKYIVKNSLQRSAFMISAL